jgi:hypothetical protein
MFEWCSVYAETQVHTVTNSTIVSGALPPPIRLNGAASTHNHKFTLLVKARLSVLLRFRINGLLQAQVNLNPDFVHMY